MPRKKRRSFNPEFKAKVAVDAIRGFKTLNELASIHGVHTNQVMTWKKHALDGMSSLFESPRTKNDQEDAVNTEDLYAKIGRLEVQIDWLKKKCPAL